jgi:excisionase family DNA binding protein
MLTPLTKPSDLKMLRINEAVEISTLCRATLYNHIRTGRLHTLKVGGRRLIPETALRKLLKIEELA